MYNMSTRTCLMLSLMIKEEFVPTLWAGEYRKDIELHSHVSETVTTYNNSGKMFKIKHLIKESKSFVSCEKPR